MELTFLGRGAAFNPSEGNTTAYFIEDKNLFLIDSGETIFSSLINNNEKVYRVYVDTTTADYDGNVHLNINKLNEAIPYYIKSKVYCMHINNSECIDEAKKMGFNVVQLKKIK